MSKKRKQFVIQGRFLPGYWFSKIALSNTWGYWGRYKTKRDRFTAVAALRQSHRNVMEFRFV